MLPWRAISRVWSLDRPVKAGLQRDGIHYDCRGLQIRAPRPVRTAARPWGAFGCSLRELEQVHAGNVLMLRGLWLAVMVALARCRVLLEHPSAPKAEEQPSIWKTALVQHLCATGFFHLHHIQ